jgi:hypothetical protein
MPSASTNEVIGAIAPLSANFTISCRDAMMISGGSPPARAVVTTSSRRSHVCGTLLTVMFGNSSWKPAMIESIRGWRPTSHQFQKSMVVASCATARRATGAPTAAIAARPPAPWMT